MHPRKLYIEVTTRCNMRCGMCVKQAPGSDISDSHLEMSLFHRLTGVFPSLEALVLNGIGEPLLHPGLDEMIGVARKNMAADAWVGFQTNGVLLDRERTERLLDAGLGRLCISVDTAPLTGGAAALLHPSRHQCSPLALARQVFDQKDHHGYLGAEIVLTRDTLPQLPSLVDHLAGEGADFIIASHLLAYHDGVEGQSVFWSCTGESWEIFTRYQSRANAEGLDLASLTASTWIAPRQPEDHRLQELYREMQAEARSRNVWLHVPKLSLFDEQEQARWHDCFAEAEAIAARHGVELSLPPLTASASRSCRFMTDDACFIDVDGMVCPCHPLWHQQTLYMDGEAKRLTPRFFGNLATTSLEAIWASPAYREFRAAATSYDYPFCHSCTLGPCPDITGESAPFENDCFGTAVPCGHCLWCYDALRCLSCTPAAWQFIPNDCARYDSCNPFWQTTIKVVRGTRQRSVPLLSTQEDLMNPLTVLVVDDDPILLSLLKKALCGQGLAVTTASNGDIALHLLAEHCFDVVLTDLQLGATSGLAVISKARQTTPAALVLMMSSCCAGDWVEVARALGAHDCLVKPFSLPSLLDRIGTWPTAGPHPPPRPTAPSHDDRTSCQDALQVGNHPVYSCVELPRRTPSVTTVTTARHRAVT